MKVKKRMTFPWFLKRAYLPLLIGIYMLSFFTRWQQVKDNLYFGYEQGRDAYRAMEIWTGTDFALVGPKTDIDGIFHGPLYYYFLAAVYGIGTQSPWVAIVLQIGIAAAVPLLIAVNIRALTGNRSAAIFGALLGATSLEVVSYGAWLSNVPLAMPLSLAALYFFIRYLKSGLERQWLIGVLLALLSTQFEIILLLEWCWVITAITVLKRAVHWKTAGIAVGMGIASVSWLALFNIVHNWMILAAIKTYFAESHGSFISGLTGLIAIYQTIIQRTQYVPEMLVIPTALLFIAGLAVLFAGNRKLETLVLCLFTFMSVPTVFFSNSVRLDQLHVNMGPGLILLLCLTLHRMCRIRAFPLGSAAAVLIAVLMIGGNLYTLNRSDGLFFVSSHGLTIQSQTDIFHTINQQFGNHPVALKSFTRPYLHEEGWQFLADYYGLQRDPGAKDIFVTIEPWVDSFWIKKWTDDLGPTTLVSSRKFGEITLEHRVRVETQ